MSFRWQTDDESGESIASDEGRSPFDPRRRRMMWVLALLAFLSIAAYFGWRTVERRAAAAEEQVRADVLATHNLARRAVEGGDAELYLSLVSGQVEGWRDVQEQLLEEGLLYGGAARLYDLVPLRNAAPDPQVVVDPDLTQATVFLEQSFALTGTESFDTSLTLRQAQSYRLGLEGWQVAPAASEFWSPRVRLIGDRVTVEYPERDDGVARPLLGYLERLLSETCASPGLDCPGDLRLTVGLTQDPASLLRAKDPQALLRGAAEVTLPSPTLAGQPVDERSQATVIRAYATQVMGPLISYLAGYDCCNRGLLVRAILERQFFHLGLRPWPLTADDHEALMEEGLTLGDALVLQRQGARAPSRETWRQMLSLVEFLESSTLPGALLTNMEGSLEAWLTESSDAGRFVAQWNAFTYMRSRSALQAQILGLSPQGTIQLTCFESDAVAVLRYDVAAEVWQHSLTYAPADGWQVDAVFAIQGGAGDIIKEWRRDDTGERLVRYVWRHEDGRDVLIETVPDAGSPHLFALAGASSTALSALVSPNYPALRASLEQEWWQIELAVCDDDQCRPQQRMARPHWSPDGEQLLLELRPETEVSGPEDLTLVRTDSRGHVLGLDHGYGPVWLGEEHYAYLRMTASSTVEELVVAATYDDQPQLLATDQEFAHVVDERPDEGQGLHLDGLQPGLGDPHLLLVQATLRQRANDGSPDTYLFGASLNPDPRGPTQQMPREKLDIEPLFHSATTMPFRLSPNGRWLAVTDFSSGWRLLDLRQSSAHDLARGGPPAWSPDGDWLVQSRNNVLLLQYPDLGYKRPLVQDLANCTFSSLLWQ